MRYDDSALQNGGALCMFVCEKDGRLIDDAPIGGPGQPGAPEFSQHLGRWGASMREYERLFDPTAFLIIVILAIVAYEVGQRRRRQ
jgi:hypothetical protein